MTMQYIFSFQVSFNKYNALNILLFLPQLKCYVDISLLLKDTDINKSDVNYKLDVRDISLIIISVFFAFPVRFF